ncbi:MAG: MipA/OmpV family protein [Alphaproteobacteria bacterium]|nr:MipA/OmpV family protein [Alphaproteobacteria bacterium]MBV9371879.1 MipA/OmpV family protein [Alphaproteobacteria bacterium]MBV9900202.1 MipA/OmpV family protein [Alphaproteobacteria bacterium]
MNLARFARAAALALPLAAATPAFAQDAGDDDYLSQPNSLTLGAGGAYVPSYEGSDDYELVPVGLAFGKVGGFGFATRGTTLTFDLVRDRRGAPVSIDFGPAANLRLDRTGRIKDPVVRALGKIDTAIEVGAYGGIAKNGVLHQYDSLGLRLTWLHDVTDTHGSSILSPSIDYSTPLSPRTFALLSLGADHVGDGYARTYFSIAPAGSLATGLPVYNADGGWKNVRASLFLGQTLTGDLRHPRLSLFAGVSYSKLLGDFARSPIVSIRGDRNQYLATLGLAYSF